MDELAYKRVLLKLSGEAMAGDKKTGIDADVLGNICDQIKIIVDMGVQVSIVIGGGNFWRGKYGHQMERTTSDYMGMLATAINALALQDALEARKVYTRMQTAIEMREIAEPYIKRKAMKHLERGRVVIFACGTGNPYFSTDTTAALRAAEIESDAILMAKNGVDGVYNDDPRKNADAVKFDKLTHVEVIKRGLKIMDATASTLSMDNDIDLVVFNMNEPGNIKRVIFGEQIGTTVSNKAELRK